MNKRLFLKLLIDFLMFSLFLWLMVASITPNYIHEILGAVFILLLIAHHVFNWRWYRGLNKGKYNLIRLIHTIVNLSLVGLIIVNIMSALGISLWLFTLLPLNWGMTG